MSQELPDEKILERIKKLHAKAVSAKEIGSEAEALTFMSAVQKMLEKYQLEMSDVEFELALKQDPVQPEWVCATKFGENAAKSTRDKEQLTIATAIARLFNCTIIQSRGRGFTVVGRRENREVCIFVQTTLLRSLEQLAQKEYVTYFYKCRDEGDVTKARGFKQGYRIGFAIAINKRAAEILTARFHQPKASVGLVRLDKEISMVTDFIKRLENSGHVKMAKHVAGRNTDNEAGVQKGFDAGNKVDLSGRAVGDQRSSKTKLLGQGS